MTLMFTDHRMPDMSGPELAEEAARRWPHLRVVLVTGCHDLAVPGWPLVWRPCDQRMLERVVGDGA